MKEIDNNMDEMKKNRNTMPVMSLFCSGRRQRWFLNTSGLGAYRQQGDNSRRCSLVKAATAATDWGHCLMGWQSHARLLRPSVRLLRELTWPLPSTHFDPLTSPSRSTCWIARPRKKKIENDKKRRTTSDKRRRRSFAFCLRSEHIVVFARRRFYLRRLWQTNRQKETTL